MRTLLIVAFFSLLLGCAHSPQQLMVKPVIDIADDAYGERRPVTVAVDDARATKILGSRGGAYKDTSVITIGNSLVDVIGRAAEAKLATQGFNINSSDANAAALIIFVDEISYSVPDQTVGKKVQLKAALRVQVTSADEQFTGRYITNSERQQLMSPSMASNEAMINDLLSATLLRLFSDPKLKAFLSNI